MDISGSINLLINFLKSSDIYDESKHFRQLPWDLLGEENEDLNDEDAKVAIDIALQELVENEVLKYKEVGAGRNKHKIYIVTESFKNSPVSLSLTKETADNVKSVVESVLPLISLEYEYNSKADVEEMDIILLLQTIIILKNEIEERIKKENDEKNKDKNKLTGGDGDDKISGGI